MDPTPQNRQAGSASTSQVMTPAAAVQLALSHQQAGRLQQAESIYRQVLAVDPNHADALHYLGVLALQVGQPAAAIDSLRRAIAVNPHVAVFHGNLGSAYGAAGRMDEAIESFRTAIRIDANFADAHNNLGTALMKTGRLEEAAASFRRAIQLRPQAAEYHNHLGSALQDLERLDQAVAAYRQALRIRPEFGDARYNIALALSKQGQLDLAKTNYEQALRINPQHADAHNNLGNVLREQGKFDEALACYEQAIAINPNLAHARKNRGMAWLRLGDYQRGWPEYQWRWQCADSPPRDFSQPQWNGSPLAGRTILIHAEQGLGDTLQFVRFLPQVQARGGRVVLECQPALVKLLSQCRGVDAIVPRGESLPQFDVHCPLLSLPTALGVTLENLSSQVPYLFVDEARRERLRVRLAAIEGFKVGINWQGNPQFRADRFRSMPLTHFEPLAKVQGVRLVSLQRGPGEDQLPAIAGRFEVVELPAANEPAETFADDAALVANLDLVVTSDTSVAHLAGALGVPVWVVIPFSPDWRWMLGRHDSPWYPTMRLFRPERIAGWDEMFSTIAAELTQRVNRQTTS
jgi:tetratricopeptide (TPR) repeat protein